MRKTIAQDSSYYESLSDISMATLGIFIIFFVINLIFINSDVITQAVKNKKLDQEIISTNQELEDFKTEEKRQIADFKKQNELQIQEIEIQIESLRSLSNNLDRSINNAQEKIKKALNVDRVISVEEIRAKLQQVKLKRDKAENEIKQIKMKANNVRHQFNKYMEVANSYPYLLISVNNYSESVLLNSVSISKNDFRGILQGIDVGSGFTFKIRNGKKSPEWLNDMLVSERLIPIIDFD